MNTQITRPPAYQKPTSFMALSAPVNNVTDATDFKVPLDVKSYNDGIEDLINNRIVINRTGYYSVLGSVEFYNVIADKRYTCKLKVNGSTFREVVLHATPSWVSPHLIVSASRNSRLFDVNDYIELFARHDSGVSTIDISNSWHGTFLNLQRVR